MDAEFEDMFRDKSQEEKEAIMKKYGIKGNYLDAPQIIEMKARDMAKYYLEKIFVNGFKAQVVTNSRKAAILYKEMIDKALQEELTKLMNGESDLENQDLIDLELLKDLETAVIISGKHNDKEFFTKHTDGSAHKRQIENFKKPFLSDSPENTGNIGLLIVKDMLLTGFDAPIEQVMFLDRKLVEHNLLQAIARVNRTRSGKNCGYLVDYYGVGNHLKDALEIFSQTDIQ